MESLDSPLKSSTAPEDQSTKFPVAQLKSQISSLLHARLIGQDYKTKPAGLTKDLAETIQAKMLEARPTGFRYVVQVQLFENRGQGARADLACHWSVEDDSVISDIFTNDSLMCLVMALAIKS